MITPMLLVEKFLKNSDGSDLADYKLYCFHGKVEYIHVDSDRYTAHTRCFYDRDWRLMDFDWAFPRGRTILRPLMLDEMIEIAEGLSSDIDFCRVDLYCTNGNRLIFGEITINPGGGWERIYPNKWDHKLGELWKIY